MTAIGPSLLAAMAIPALLLGTVLDLSGQVVDPEEVLDSTREETVVKRVAGCYELEIGDWSPAYVSDRQTFPIPAIVWLRSDRNDGMRTGASSRAVDVLVTHGRPWPGDRTDGFQRWDVSGDSIGIHLNSGPDGYQFFLEESHEGEIPELKGTITAWDEWSGADPTAPVFLSRVDCEVLAPSHESID